MCGRFTLRSSQAALLEMFQLNEAPELRPRYNIAPTQQVAVVRLETGNAERALVMLRWGLIPSWAKDPAIGNRMINARSETAAEKPAFRAAMRRRRCLLPADGYYEWTGSPKAKQPHLIHREQDQPFAMAGLWERWDGSNESDVPGPLESVTILTTGSNQLTRDLHERMPVILNPADFDRWLDPTSDVERDLKPLLFPQEAADWRVDPVNKHINNAKHDNPACAEIERKLF